MPVMGSTLGIMFTMTTYGTWLRGDSRGWVDDGTIMPPDPVLEAADRALLIHEPYYFDQSRLLDIGDMIGRSLRERLQQRILALTVQRWHMHLVVAATTVPIPDIVKCTKDAVRYGLRPGRPIWADGCDKRFCFDTLTLCNRVIYVEKHNLAHGWPARPWTFIEDI